MADNLSLLSAVLSFGYGDTHAASGIPSRRIYTLTERSAAAWSELLRLATVGGDVYSATERPGAIDAAVAFVEAVPTERIGRMQRAQASKLLKRLATAKVSAMTRRSNPSESVRIMRSANPAKTSDALATVRRYFPSATVSRTDSDGSRRTAYVGRLGPARGEPGTEHTRIVWIEPGAASVRIRVYRYADPRIDRTLSAHVLVSERVVEPADLGAALAAVIAEQGNGARTGNPAPKAAAGPKIFEIVPHADLQSPALWGIPKIGVKSPVLVTTLHGLKVAYPIAPSADASKVYYAVNPDGSPDLNLELVQEKDGRWRVHYYTKYENGRSLSDDTLEMGITRLAEFQKLVDRKIAEEKAYSLVSWLSDHDRGPQKRYWGLYLEALDALGKIRYGDRSSWRNPDGTLVAADVFDRIEAIRKAENARTGNPPALIWEFDGEPTSPKELLADNPDNGDVAAAVAYLKAEGAKFSMGRHGTKGVRSWSAVSFGGGAADESVLTVRADWTDGPVFKAVLDASTIPYAGDLPDAD